MQNRDFVNVKVGRVVEQAPSGSEAAAWGWVGLGLVVIVGFVLGAF